MLTTAFVGETCHYCKRPFRPDETIQITNNIKSCKPGIGCTQQNLDRNGVRGLQDSGRTGPLTEMFQRQTNSQN